MTDSKAGADKALALTIVSGATMLALMIFTVPLTTLTPTAQALAAGPSAQAWMLSGMPLGAAAGLLGAGALGDNHGRRRVFLWGLAVMFAASLAGALAPGGITLILARVIQGLGSAAVLACGLGLLGQAFVEAHERIRATAIWAAGLGAGVASGPIFASALTMVGGWRAAYLGTGLLAAALLALGRHRLPDTEASHGGRVDWLGSLLLVGGLACLMSALTELRIGWARPVPMLLALAGAGLLAGFVVVERRHANPILDLSLFRRADFVGATVAAFASGAGILALMTLVPTLLQRFLDTGALAAAFVLLGWSLTSVVTALSARWLPSGLSPRALMIGGLVACAVAQLMLFGPEPDSSALRFLPGLLLAGAANGILNAALGRQAVASVPARRTAMGSGANNTARYLGSAIGITLGAVLIAHGEAVNGMAGLVTGWDQAVVLSAGFSLLGALVVAMARD
ncbi:MFS transporter [Halomonas organivorans]|uniref:MFS family permease n=1 Tax=Halomonas organivorans TaxID=257772 RepID=A0A7W5BXE5_9GAMM|nr:MFS transporter [Halomonas organivorans]MBB3139918.1 MFS family permease [Halomonas organivorans]